jgi:hypothetical protein
MLSGSKETVLDEVGNLVLDSEVSDRNIASEALSAYYPQITVNRTLHTPIFSKPSRFQFYTYSI